MKHTKGQEEIIEILDTLRQLCDENPCNVPDHVFANMAAGFKFLLGCIRINKQQAADLFGVTPKTIDRWRKEKNFPCEDSNGGKCVSIKVDMLVDWKLEHYDEIFAK